MRDAVSKLIVLVSLLLAAYEVVAQGGGLPLVSHWRGPAGAARTLWWAGLGWHFWLERHGP